jgi:hypothetical protein
MVTHPTLEQMRALKLDGMAHAFTELEAQDRAKELSHAEWLGLLLDREMASPIPDDSRPACGARLRLAVALYIL